MFVSEVSWLEGESQQSLECQPRVGGAQQVAQGASLRVDLRVHAQQSQGSGRDRVPSSFSEQLEC